MITFLHTLYYVVWTVDHAVLFDASAGIGKRAYDLQSSIDNRSAQLSARLESKAVQRPFVLHEMRARVIGSQVPSQLRDEKIDLLSSRLHGERHVLSRAVDTHNQQQWYV